MIAFALAFFLGALSACFLPERIPAWVRGALRRLWKRCTGNLRASTLPRAEAVSGDAGAIVEGPRIFDEVSPKRDKKPIEWGRALSNIAQFFAGLFGFVVKHPVLCIGLIVLAAFLVFGGPRLPFGLGGKSKDVLALEARLSQAETRQQELQAELNTYAANRGDRTQRRERAIERAVQSGQEDLEDAATQNDFDLLYRTYVGAYRRVWHDTGADESVPDPAPRRPDRVRRPRADAA